eukprot:763991-Hanusia_phi.AAC.4
MTREASMSRIRSSQTSLEASPVEACKGDLEGPEARRIAQLRAQAKELLEELEARKDSKEPGGAFLYRESQHDLHKVLARNPTKSSQRTAAAPPRTAQQGKSKRTGTKTTGGSKQKAAALRQRLEALEVILKDVHEEMESFFEKRSAQLQRWEAGLQEREQAIQTASELLHVGCGAIEVFVQMYVEQREREVQMKMVSTKEIRNEINNELQQWEADLKQREIELETKMGHMASQCKKEEIYGQESRLRKAWSELERERN